MHQPTASANASATSARSSSEAARTFAPQYAEVAIPLRVAQTFTYRLPSALRRDAQVGARLLVPFGRKLVSGYIVALHSELDSSVELSESEIKDAEELLDREPLLTKEVLEITRWIAEYYAAPWGEALKAALPAGLNATIEQVLSITSEGRDELARLPSKRAATARAQALRFIAEEGETTLREVAGHIGEARMSAIVRRLEQAGWITRTHRARTVLARAKRRKAVRLLPLEAHTDERAARALTPAQQRIIETRIAADGEMAFSELLAAVDTSASTINTLERRRIVEVFVREVRRDPLSGATFPEVEDLRLTERQQSALSEIEAALRENDYAAFLLHGVTGSGKTEIYIRAMRAALDKGSTAMMLVPEIALTPVFLRRLGACFGDSVAIFHSCVTTGGRFDAWIRLKRGERRVVIGTR